MFQVGVESLIRIELRAVAWQVKDFDVGLVLGKPCLDRLAVMHAEVVEDQEHFLARALAIGHQRLEEINELLVVKGTIDDHPACLALIGHCGNHRQLLSRTSNRHRDRGLPFWSITAAPNIRIHQRGFVTPVNLATFGLGTLLDGQILLIDPLLDRLRSLFVSALDRLFRRETPALEVVSDRTY
ncbi:MAG: hypothetical protein MO853_04430 [Candidatus Protistobacter heckmanni]|nr:hypothetical protein [Candidatus Protistobacter heckmanni]